MERLKKFFLPIVMKPTEPESIANWLIRLRWMACFVALVLILITILGLRYLDSETLWPLLGLVGVLALSNLLYSYLLKRELFIRNIGEIQIIADLVILTLMLIFSGGIENPLSFIYLFHVILSGILFNKAKCYGAVAVSFLTFSFLALGDLYGILPHYTLHIYPHDAMGEIHIHAAHYPLYVWSMMGIQLVVLVLTAYFITEIMERLRREEKRSQEEEQRLQGVLEATGAGLIILNKEFWPVWFNNPILKWIGIDAQDRILSVRDWIQNIQPELESVWHNKNIQVVEREQVEIAGQKRVVQITIAPLINEGGETFQVVALTQDITEIKIMEAEMIQAAKMASLGTMATGVAHEVGNPLASISARLQRMQENDTKDFLHESIPLLQKEILRIERIVHGISQFSQPSRDRWEKYSVNRIIRETVEIIKYHNLAKKFRVDVDLDDSLPDILMVRDQLKQAVLNLLLNALESETDQNTVKILSNLDNGRIVISIQDFGKGLTQDVQEKVFEPFFTTKARGSGLGLFIVNQIVQTHDGQIDVKSDPGKGTIFSIFLPIDTKRTAVNNTKRRTS